MAETTRPLRPLIISELNPPLNITVVTDGEGCDKIKKHLARVAESGEPNIGLDTETNITVDFWNRRIRTIQIGDKNEQFVVDLLAFAGNSDKLFESQGHYGKNNGSLFTPVLDALTPALCSNTFMKVGANLPFEYSVFKWSFGTRIWNLFSIDLAERVIWAGAHSLKDYPFYSLEQIVGRRFGLQIDKSKQKSFDLESPLTQEQIEYSALDIRMPLAVRLTQMKELTKDQLLATSTIENDALGSYTDMHLTGQAINTERWITRIGKTVARRQEELKVLDEGFLPVVGDKATRIDYAKLDRLEKIWKEKFEITSPEEMDKALQVRMERNSDKKAVLRTELNELERARKQLKAAARVNYSILSKQRTADLKIIEKCEGQAFINYGSGPQLIAALNRFKGIKIEDSSDDTLLKYNDRPLIQSLRSYKKGKKDTGTYGLQWTQRWTTKPCKEEGWLHPGDGRLHCVFNQLDADTGRSSSAKPNAQNLPKDDDVRACFVCDPPDESIRISTCCDDETTGHGPGVYTCNKCNKLCETKAEEYVIVTIDMAGAELRIIAELANAESWIRAFSLGWDVHSVGTEILYPEQWPTHTVKSKIHPDGWTIDDCKNEKTDIIVKGKPIGPCAYFAKNESGDFLRLKCDCPGHKKLRDANKATNFLLCYGGGPPALADALGVSLDEAYALYKLHEQKFPDIWGYLKLSGILAKERHEARDMFGRRRLLPPPTWDSSKEWFMDEHADDLELPEEDCKAQIFAFKSEHFREPNEDEEYRLTHRPPTVQEIKWAMRGMIGSIERRGKNHCIQGTNASIIKRAMGCGFDKFGQPYLWHTLPLLKAKLLSMVHDELIVQCPKRFGQQVFEMVGNAFKRAAAEVMSRVVMEYDGNISDRWMK